MNSFMPGAKLGTACLKARAALLASMQDGAFKNVLVISQLLPVLNGKSYVDLISPDCGAPRGSWAFQWEPCSFQSAESSLKSAGPREGRLPGPDLLSQQGFAGPCGTHWQQRCSHSFQKVAVWVERYQRESSRWAMSLQPLARYPVQKCSNG